MPRDKLIQTRRDTTSNWASVNPVLADGEQGYEKDTHNIKIGDGVTAWNSLQYFKDLSGYATTTSLATTNSNVSANTTAISNKQSTLVNQTNIKSINGQSLLGSGDIVVSGGSSGITYPAIPSGRLFTPFTNLTTSGQQTGPTYDIHLAPFMVASSITINSYQIRSYSATSNNIILGLYSVSSNSVSGTANLLHSSALTNIATTGTISIAIGSTITLVPNTIYFTATWSLNNVFLTGIDGQYGSEYNRIFGAKDATFSFINSFKISQTSGLTVMPSTVNLASSTANPSSCNTFLMVVN